MKVIMDKVLETFVFEPINLILNHHLKDNAPNFALNGNYKAV
jgi:hypothetical protein